MDSITRTAQSAVVSYYNTLRKNGGARRGDREKLLTLWLFHYLKNRSDFLAKPVLTKDDDGKITWCDWKVDTELEAQLERAYRKNLPCLTAASCFIHLLPDDECIPLLEIFWDGSVDYNYRILVTNATEILASKGRLDGESVQGIMDSYVWKDNSALMQPNDEAEDTLFTRNN